MSSLKKIKIITGDKSVATLCFAERAYTGQPPRRAGSYQGCRTSSGMRRCPSTTWLPQRHKDVIVHNIPPCNNNSFLITFPPPGSRQRGRPRAERLLQKREVREQDFEHGRTAGHRLERTSRETSRDSSLALSHYCQNTWKQCLTFVFP